jgi:FkbM family methyltransferase
MENSDRYFAGIDTVIHVGAHLGEERLSYLRRNLTVFWVEASASAYQQLNKNIKAFSNQKAIHAAVHSSEEKDVVFNITNLSASSSLLKPKDVWPTPDLKVMAEEKVDTVKLSTLITYGTIKLTGNSMLIIDTQGTEFDVLLSAGCFLTEFAVIVIETQDFELYEDQVLTEKIEEFLINQKFHLAQKTAWASDTDRRKNCYELIFENRNSREKLCEGTIEVATD